MHQRDNQRLILALQNLRDIGNSMLVVEHDKDIMMAADYLVISVRRQVFTEVAWLHRVTPEEMLKLNTLTADYLNGHSTDCHSGRKKKGKWEIPGVERSQRK